MCALISSAVRDILFYKCNRKHSVFHFNLFSRCILFTFLFLTKFIYLSLFWVRLIADL